ncbi:MAG: hypothetical protein ACLGGX_12180 [Bdellovibrionia bacterium]
MKKDLLKVAALLLAFNFNLACSEMNQDPLHDASPAIRNAKRPETKPEIPRPVDSDALKIDAPAYVRFLEGVEKEITLTPRILLDGYVVDIFQIKNLSSFKNATFDAQTGVFKWNPPHGTTPSGLIQELVLQVEMLAKPTDPRKKELFTEMTLPIFVQKVPREPVIQEVRASTTDSFREGTVNTIFVTVFDGDSSGTSTEEPELIITPGTSRLSVASFAKVTRNYPDPNADRTWKYEIQVNLVGAEVTDTRFDTDFRVHAVNSFGKKSAPELVRFSVVTDFVSTVESTYLDNSELVINMTNNVVFTLFEPKGEAIVSFKSVAGLPPGSILDCPNLNRSWINCRFDWKPLEADAKKTFPISITVDYRNKSNLDRRVVNRTARINIRTGAADTSIGLPPVDPDKSQEGNQ